MKRFFFIIAMLTIFSCSNQKDKVELLDPSGEEYYDVRLVNPLSKNSLTDSLYNFDKGQIERISETFQGIKKIIAKNSDNINKTYQYKLFIDKNGAIEKILVVYSGVKEIDIFLQKQTSSWKMKSFYFAGKPHKYTMPFSFNLVKDYNDSLKVLLSSLRGNKKIDLNDLVRSVNNQDYFVAVEEMPMPIGGMREIAKNVHYPEIAKRAGIEGRVFVKAFIDENGNVVETEIIKGIGGGCDQAALDAIEATKFKPGRKNGKPVKVQVSIPIMFKLD